MFSNLRQGSQLYIFHKSASTPFIEMGSVEMQNPFGPFYQAIPNMPMNISIRIGDKVIAAPNLPPNAEVADVTNNQTGEVITLVCSREAVNAEIHAERQKSVDTVNSVDYHRQRISALDTLYNQINPEVAEKAMRDKELSDMRQQMAQMAQTIEQLTCQLKGEGASSNSKE